MFGEERTVVTGYDGEAWGIVQGRDYRKHGDDLFLNHDAYFVSRYALVQALSLGAERVVIHCKATKTTYTTALKNFFSGTAIEHLEFMGDGRVDLQYGWPRKLWDTVPTREYLVALP